MTWPHLRYRLCWLPYVCVLLGSLLGFYSLPLGAQNLEKPSQTVDKDVTAFAYASDGRIMFSVNQTVKTKQYELEHDDIWLQESNGKSKRIFQGEKYTRGHQQFSYVVNSLRWSPNNRAIVAELFTTSVDDTGKTTDSYQTLILEDTGKEIKIAGGDFLLLDSANPVWLLDNATIVSLGETVKPRQLFSFKAVNRSTGNVPSPPFEGRTFRDVSWIPGTNVAVAIEQDHSMTGPPRLQHLDMSSDNDTELITLDSYEGGLTVSPTGKKAAYYIDKEVLEIRDLLDLTKVARLRVGLGTLRWTPDESRIFIKRSPEKKSGDIISIDVPALASSVSKSEIPILRPSAPAVLHGLTFRDFAISPNGASLAVVATGTRNLLTFPLPR